MPVIRYQIRNEYGLADPELYKAADREDPEALLEGVAMAGLVGVLRQLGDLSEFAAEVFHGLHEEVMATAARGHGLKLRVQQLEAEFPAIEKAFLSQTSHSHLTSDTGIEWHPNLKVDQNVVTRGDMPRFILDSYEECRGPPRLFVLDKFDIAGAGACLKRYSDPSFFKMDLASSGTMEPEFQREKKGRKIKRKGPRWKNVEAPITPSHVNSILQTVASDKLAENNSVRRVKLKARCSNDLSASNGRSYMARVLERHSPEHIVCSENCTSELAAEAHMVCNPMFRDRTTSEILSTQKMVVSYKNGLNEHMTKNSLKEQTPNGDSESSPSDFQRAEEKKLLENIELRDKDFADNFRSEELEKTPVTFRDVDQKEPLSDAEMKTDGSIGGYKSDDITSELDNYMDALATMESEMETDTESRAKADVDLGNIEHLRMDSEMNEEQQDLQSHSSERHSSGSSSVLVDHSIRKSSVSSETSSRDITGLQLSQGNGSTYSDIRTDLEMDPSESTELTDYTSQIKNEISDVESSSPVVPKGICTLDKSDAFGLYEYEERSSSPNVTESEAVPLPLSPLISPSEVLSDTMHPNKVSLSDTTHPNKVFFNFDEGSFEIGGDLGSDLSPHTAPDKVQSVVAGINEVSSDNSESFEDNDGHSYVDSTHSAGSYNSLSQTDAHVLLGRVESSEILHPDITNATEPSVTESSIEIKDDRFPAKSLPVGHVEGLTSDSLSNTSGPPEEEAKLHEDAVSENASIGDGVAPDSISTTVCKEGRSMKQDSQPDSDNKLEILPVFSPENSFIDPQSVGSLMTMENVVPPYEGSEISGSLELKQETSGIFSLGSQRFSDTDGYHMVSAELLPSDSVKETILGIPDVLSNSSDHEVGDELMPNGDLQKTRCMTLKLDDFSQETEYHVESHECLSSCSGQELPDILEARSSSSDHEEGEEVMPMRDSLNLPHDSIVPNSLSVALQAMHQEAHDVDSEEVLPSCSGNEMAVEILQNKFAGESRDLPMPVCDHHLCCSFMDSNSPVVVEGHMSCHELFSEYITEEGTGEYISVENSSQEVSGIPVHVQEDCISKDLVSDEHNLDIDGTSSQKDSIRLAAQTFPDINISQQKEDVLAPTDLKSGQQILDSLGHSDVGLVNVSLTESAHQARADMSPTCSYKDSISLQESELQTNPKSSQENQFRCSNFLEEGVSNNSTSDQHKMEISVASSPEDLTRFSGQETPQVSGSDQEVVDTAFSPRVLNAHVLVHGSSASSEAMNPIGHTISSELAKLDLNPADDEESIASPIEGGAPYLALVQCHPYKAASDISPSYAFHTEPAVPLEESSKSQAGRPSSEITLSQEDINLEHSDCQLASAQSLENNATSNGCSTVDVVRQVTKPETEPEPEVSTHALVMDSQINSLELESVLFQPNSELSSSSLNSNFSPLLLPTFPELSTSLGQPFETLSDEPDFSFSPREGNTIQSLVDEAPPLPPLPPLEWRTGKLQLGSMMSDGGKSQPSNGHKPFTQTQAMDDSHGFARVEGGMMLPLNPFEEASMPESKSHQHSYQTSEGCPSSGTMPFFEEGRCKQGAMSVDRQMDRSLPNLLIDESHMEDEKHLHARGVFGKDALPPSNPFVPVPASFCETLSSERHLIHPSNPFLFVSTQSDEMFHYDYRDILGENMQYSRTLRPLYTAEDAADHLTTVRQVHLMEDVLLTATDDMPTMPTRNPHSILNRPRDPLMEAVALHDRSTLRKVSELVRPSTKPEMDERETLLEQIRNKSFNLKPAVAAKPIIKGPSTNLKVAAILEKANAIRQAVGSDEDDDGDSWSDC